MKQSRFLLTSFILLLFSFNCFAEGNFYQTTSPVQNTYQVQQTWLYYYESGQYEKDIQITIDQIKAKVDALLKQNVHSQKKLAAVFDIDETVLSNWPIIKKSKFIYYPVPFRAWINKAQAKPIIPVTTFYHYLQANNVAIFFITGRSESLRQATIKNLNAAGLTGYKALYLMPNSEPTHKIVNVASYKTNIRHLIESQGYDIIVSIGDQYSDLCGSYADNLVKLPNPFYFIPGCSAKQICQWATPDSLYAKQWKEVCPILYGDKM